MRDIDFISVYHDVALIRFDLGATTASVWHFSFRETRVILKAIYCLPTSVDILKAVPNHPHNIIADGCKLGWTAGENATGENVD